MDVATLKAKIKSKQLPSYLIFSGDEWKVQQIYINQIAKVTGKEIKRIDDVTSIYRKLRNKSFVQNGVIYIVRDDKELMNSEKLQQQIESGLLGDNILIHLLTSVDKRTKFYKAHSASIIVFERLSDAMLKKYISKEIKLSESNIQRLIDICEHDYGRILLEIDKIKRYAQGFIGDYGYDNFFQMLVEDGTIYEPPYDAIFDLVDAILDRKVNRAFDLLQQSYAVGEATMVMLSVLYNNAKAVLQVQTYKGNELSKATGLTGWQIKNAKPHVGKYSENELIYILQLCQKLESGIKTGRMEDEFAMQYLLTHIM
ncbi:hypothetical protein J6O48_08345 [bacterium]|nr:hypothetical protein [bacterium]